MNLSQIVIIAGIVVYFLIRKQLREKYTKDYVKSIRATVIVPILHIILFTAVIYAEGDDAAKGASRIDSLHNISTYTPYLGDLGEGLDIANQLGVLPDIERSQGTLEFISAARMATNAVTVGILIVIVLALAELYGVIRLGKFTKKQMLMFYGGISVTFIICSIVVAVWSKKLMVMLSFISNANDSNFIVFIFPAITLLMVGVPYIYYKRALDRLFFKHEEESAAEPTEQKKYKS